MLQRGPSEALWDVLQSRHAALGHLWAVVDASCMLPLWAFVGVVLGRFGSLLGCLGPLLGHLGASWRPSAVLGLSCGLLGTLLGTSWDAPEAVLGPSGGSLGQFSGPLGPCRGPRGPFSNSLGGL